MVYSNTPVFTKTMTRKCLLIVNDITMKLNEFIATTRTVLLSCLWIKLHNFKKKKKNMTDIVQISVQFKQVLHFY